jgi:hypothetical protein
MNPNEKCNEENKHARRHGAIDSIRPESTYEEGAQAVLDFEIAHSLRIKEDSGLGLWANLS